jgi:uncharacterized protein (TIGR02099 family)
MLYGISFMFRVPYPGVSKPIGRFPPILSFVHIDSRTLYRAVVRPFLLLLLAAYFLFAVALLSLRYLVLPTVNDYRPTIERVVSGMLRAPVHIGHIDASWLGLHPRLVLSNVDVLDAQGRVALALPRVATVLSWRSVVLLEPRMLQFQLDAPEVDVRRDTQGRFQIAGLLIDLNDKSHPHALEHWLFAQREITVRGALVRWTDDMRQAPPLELRNVAFTLRNTGLHHRGALRVEPPAALASPIDVRADFTHGLFEFEPTEVARWKGSIYGRLDHVDVAGWRPWVDLPGGLERGAGALRAWLDVDHGRLLAGTGDIALTDVAGHLKPELPELALTRAVGRIDAANSQAGHRLSLAGLTLETSDAILIQPQSVNERWTAESRQQPARGTLTVEGLDLAALDKLADRLPLSDNIRQRIADTQPAGRIDQLRVDWEGQVDTPRNVAVSARFTGLSMAAAPVPVGVDAHRPQRPGFTNLSGTVQADRDGGSLALDAHDLTLSFPGVFEQPVLPFKHFVAQARLIRPANGPAEIHMTQVDFEQTNLQGQFTGVWKAEGKSHSGTLDIAGKIAHADVRDIPALIPLGVGEGVRTWLQKALLAGTVSDVGFKVQGDLREFPFGNGRLGQFSVGGRLQNVTLDYAPPRPTDKGWPRLENLVGNIAFDRLSMTIDAQTGKARVSRDATVDVGPTRAHIDNVEKDPMLEIEGETHGPAANFLTFASTSAVGHIIDGALDQATATGNFTVPLSLHIPLHDLSSTQVAGEVQLAGNEFRIQPGAPPLQRLAGSVGFGNDGLSMRGVTGMLLDGPVRLAAAPQGDGTDVLRLDGTAAASGLAQLWRVPGVSRFKGQAVYAAKVVFGKGRPPSATLDSNLAGMAIDLPAPLGKAAPDAVPLHAEWGQSGPDVAGKPGVDWLAAGLGSVVNLHVERDRDPAGGVPVLQAAVGVNRAATLMGPGLSLAVDLPEVDVDAWGKLAAEFSTGAKVQPPPALAATAPDESSPAVGGLVAAMPATAATATPSLAQASSSAIPAVSASTTPAFPPLTRVNLKTAKLMVKGRQLDGVSLYAARDMALQGGGWRTDIQSEQLAGRISWTDAQPASAGRLTARLSRLVIGKEHDAGGGASDLLSDSATDDVPDVDVVADSFELFGKSLGRLEVQARRDKGGHDWQLNHLSVKNPDAEFDSSGVWRLEPGDPEAARRLLTLDANLRLIDTGKFLDRMGVPGTMKGGSGRLTGHVSWRGQPYSLDLPTLAGQLELQLDKGQFLKADPGIAKLLGVLSLQSLPRRVTLDFRDVFSQGFAYDTIRANVGIANGLAHTDNFKMSGANATVVLAGDADMARETQNLHVVVVPKVDAGAAPLLYGLINPAVGLSVFLAQWLLHAPLAQAFTYQYAITGDWSDPHIERVANQPPAKRPGPTDAKAD